MALDGLTLAVRLGVGIIIVSGVVCIVAALVHHASQTKGAGSMNSSWKTAWTALLINAAMDFYIAMSGGLMVGNAATGEAYPTGPTLFYSALAAGLVAARRIQQAISATPTDAADLRGIPVTAITKLPGISIIAAPTQEAVAKQVERSQDGVLEKPVKPSKAPIALLLLGGLLGGCAGIGGPHIAQQTAAEIRETAKIKDVAVFCGSVVYAGAKANWLVVNSDKGIPAGIEIDTECKTRFITGTGRAGDALPVLGRDFFIVPPPVLPTAPPPNAVPPAAVVLPPPGRNPSLLTPSTEPATPAAPAAPAAPIAPAPTSSPLNLQVEPGNRTAEWLNRTDTTTVRKLLRDHGN